MRKSDAEQLADANEIIKRKNRELISIRRDVSRMRADAEAKAKAITGAEFDKLTGALPKQVGRLRRTSTVHGDARVMVTYEADGAA